MMNRKKVLIVGAGTAGVDIAREIKKYPELMLIPVGFVDDDNEKQGKRFYSLKVYGKIKDLSKIIKQRKVDEVLIAMPSADGDIVEKVIDACSKQKIAFKIVPQVKEIIEGRAEIKRVRDVKVEDLLNRPINKSEVIKLEKYLKNKIILVTGAAGSIGSELSRQIASYKPKLLILFDWWENGLFNLDNEFKEDFSKVKYIKIVGNIQDKNRVSQVFKKYHPEFVFHAAAYKHVPMMEDNPLEAIKNNVFGTDIVAREAIAAGVKKFLFISTDKAVKPKCIMGMTKLVGEYIVRDLNRRNKTKFIAVRFGNVLDSQGSVIPTFKKQIARGGPVTVTNPKMTRFFMTIPEATNLLLQSIQIGEGGEVFVLDMGKEMKILDLAVKLIRLSGLVPNKDIEIKFTGTRSGEKLREELFSDNEKVTKIKSKIYRSINNKDVRQYFNTELGALARLVSGRRDKESVEMLKKIIAE